MPGRVRGLSTAALFAGCAVLLGFTLPVIGPAGPGDAPRAGQPDASRFGPLEGSGLRWLHLSSRHGDLPVPGTSTQQTGARVADLDGDVLMDVLDKPYNWDVPRVDVWLQRRAGNQPEPAVTARARPMMDRPFNLTPRYLAGRISIT